MTSYFGRQRFARYPADPVQVVVPVILSFFFFFAMALYILYPASTNLPVGSISSAEQAQPAMKMVSLLVPVRDILPDEVLNPTLFRLERRPEASVPAVSLRDPEQANGQFAKAFLLKGQPIPFRAISAVPTKSHIRDSIPDGYRAVSIRVNEVISVGGWVSSGSHVDVLWIKKQGQETVLVPLVDNAQVIAVERSTRQEVKPGTPIPATVTLMAVVDDANKIQLASSTGSLRLNLRNRSESKVHRPQKVLREGQLGHKVPQKQAPVATDGEVTIDGAVYRVTPRGKMIPGKMNAAGL